METEIARSILNELITYFYTNDIYEIKMGVSFQSEGFYIEIQGETSEKPDSLETLARLLSIPREASNEYYYHELLGNLHHEEEDYQYLGTLIDEVEIMYDTPILDIKVFRKKL